MHRDTNLSALPALMADLLQESGYLVDNLFADLWREMGMKMLLNRSGFRKRSGTPMHELVYGLMLWVWLKVDSIGMFARESLQTFSCAEKDALYDAMNREDVNWRHLHEQVASKVQALHHSFRDGRSCVAKRYRVAHEQTKPQMAKAMVHRALSSGIEGDYLLADAWFGTKPMIRLADEACIFTEAHDHNSAALLLIFLLLYFTFRNIVEPVIVMRRAGKCDESDIDGDR